MADNPNKVTLHGGRIKRHIHQLPLGECSVNISIDDDYGLSINILIAANR
jgi:hypothetical protein